MKSFTVVFVCIFLLLSPAVSAPYGDWATNMSTDPMTDESRNVALTMAKGGDGAFILMCSSGGYIMMFNADKYIGDNPIVQCRFDDHKALPEFQAIPGPQGTHAAFPLEYQDRYAEFARRATKLRVKITDYQGVNHYYEFSLVGMTKATNAIGCVD